MDIVELLRKDEKSMLVDGHVKLVNWVAADEIERLRDALLEVVYCESGVGSQVWLNKIYPLLGMEEFINTDYENLDN